jgi:hypothetical protein
MRAKTADAIVVRRRPKKERLRGALDGVSTVSTLFSSWNFGPPVHNTNNNKIETAAAVKRHLLNDGSFQSTTTTTRRRLHFACPVLELAVHHHRVRLLLAFSPCPSFSVAISPPQK